MLIPVAGLENNVILKMVGITYSFISWPVLCSIIDTLRNPVEIPLARGIGFSVQISLMWIIGDDLI